MNCLAWSICWLSDGAAGAVGLDGAAVAGPRCRCSGLLGCDPGKLRLHGDRRLTLLLGLLVVGRQRQQLVEISNGAGIIALCAEQLAPRKIGCALRLRRLRDGAGEILDRMIDVAFSAVDLATPEKCVWSIRVEGKRGVEFAERLIELRRFDEGASASDIGRSQILAQHDRLVEVGKRFRPGLLVASEIAAGEEREGILRFKLDRQVQIGARQIEAAASLAQISAQQQSGDKLRIKLKRSLGVFQREIQFRTARVADARDSS